MMNSQDLTNNGHQLKCKIPEMQISSNPSHIIMRIQFPIQLATT
jgi:hypothetical protein